MTREEKIERLRNLPKAYILYSLYTRMPFVECEQQNFYDQAFLFETHEDAVEAGNRMIENGDAVGITELKTTEMPRPEGENSNVIPMKKLMRNQVREHLSKFPLMGLNAVFFKPAGERGESFPLDEVLPQQVKDAIEGEKNELMGVRLTGMYFAQYMRRKDKDVAQAKERYEEFYANLARAKFLLPVIPEKGHENDPSINLTTSMLPIYTPTPDKNEKGEDEEPVKMSALGLFTNMDELVVHSRNHVKDVRIVRVAPDEVKNFLPESVEFIVIDPLTMSITLKIDDVVRILKEIRS